MAFSNIQRDMQSFFNAVAKGVREDMNANLVHHLDINFRDTALGFHKAAARIANDENYIKGDAKGSWERVIRKLCSNWNEGSTGLTPGQVFTTVRQTARAGGGLRSIGVPNATVINFSQNGCTIQLLVASSSGMGSQKIDTFLTNFRKLVWKKWNKDNEKKLAYGAAVGETTNFGHSQQSTVGLKQMQELDNARQAEPDNPFTDARDFIGKAGFLKTVSLEQYVKNQLLGKGASIEFTEKYINGRKENVVVGRIDPSNKAGSEVTDKKQFNAYIKKYYKEHFLNHFNALKTKDKKKLANSMNFKTIADFRQSEPYSSKLKKEAANRIAKELSSGKTLKTLKTQKKPKRVSKTKKITPKTAVGNAMLGTKALKGNVKRGRPTKRTQAQRGNSVALRELLNAVLPEEILKNMGSPALNNRTGRFRQSARVTNVLIGPKGGTQVDYTYQLNPYETFEPGGAMGSTARDPRRLIGNTIREVAQEIMGKRFIKTRRV